MTIISYDVWDTIIRRTVHPDMVKIWLADHLIEHHAEYIKPDLRDSATLLHYRQLVERAVGQRSVSLGKDDEYHLHEVIGGWLHQVTISGVCDMTTLTQDLYDRELSFERRCIYLDPNIVATFDADGADKRIFVSDFYMGQGEIRKFLEHLGVASYFHDGYSSVDYGLNKRSGRLFERVLEVEGITAADLYHTGDNAYSDVEVPKRLGIYATHYVPMEEHTQRERREQEFSRFKHVSDELKGRLNSLAMSKDSSSALSVIFVDFIKQVQAVALDKQVGKVFFFTREGEFFQRLYQVLRDASPLKAQMPEAELLEVSRIATFAPSIFHLSLDEMMRVWNLYSTQSPGAMLKTLDLNAEEFKTYFDRYDMPLDVTIKYPWLDQRMQRLFQDDEFISLANSAFSEKRRRMCGYLSSRGLVQGLKSCVVVDIGWRGTIQDNIAKVFPETMFHGIYLGLSKMLNPQYSNVSKYAAGPDLNKDDSSEDQELLRFVAPLEMLTNSDSGSVVGYDEDQSGWRAVRYHSKAEDEVFHNFTNAFQKRMLDVVRENADLFLSFSLDRELLKKKSRSAWWSLMKRPPVDVVKAYFGLSHNETFGVGAFVPRTEGLGRFWLVHLALSKEYRRTFKSRVNGLGWTDGYITLTNGYVLKFVLDNFYS